MNEINVKAYAKLNLTLNVLEKRTDNYHNIESVFQRISLYDEIHIKKRKDNKFNLFTNKEEINNDDNIIKKAYDFIKRNYPLTGVDVKLIKKIPIQAGLGGGSADCASFIISLNKLFDLKLSFRKLEEIAIKLGSDVPPCLYNGTLLVNGKGDIITKIKSNLKMYFIIIKPNIALSTKEMYEKIDSSNCIIQKYNSQIVKDGIETNDIEKVSNNLYNVFEKIIDNKIYKSIREDLLENKAIGCLLTGSGSCMYGIFEDKNVRDKAYINLKNNYEIYKATTIN